MESNLCTVNDLKKLTPISENIDVELLHPHLMISQQLYIAPVLGTALYDDIIDRFDNNRLTGDTQTLYEEYIVPALGYGAWYAAAPFLNYKTQRTGIATQGTDTLTPVTPEELSIYIERVNNLRIYYQNRMEQYLIDNKTSFPLYRQDDVHQHKGGTFFTGWDTIRKHADYWDKSSNDESCGDTESVIRT